MHWYIKVLKNYANFDGRARRKEYWFFYLINFLISISIMLLEFMAIGWNPEGGGVPIFYGLYTLAVLIPSLAVGVRRLHDIGRSGWWLLISLVPFVGAIVLLVFFFMEGDSGTNQYGPDPKANATII